MGQQELSSQSTSSARQSVLVVEVPIGAAEANRCVSIQIQFN